MAPKRAAAVGAFGVLGLAGSFVEPHLPVLRHVTIPLLPTRHPPIRLLHLSDLHLLPRHGRRSRWIRALARLEADLVVCTGDLLSSPEAVALLGATLGALTARGTPAFFVPGNNDYYRPVRPSLRRYLRPGPSVRRGPDLPWAPTVQALEAVGWTELTHRRVTVPVGDLTLTLAGTDDAHLRRDVYPRVAGRIGTDLGIAVLHTPQRRLLEAFAADGYRLMLAGHTHGGQVRLPGIGALLTNCDLPRSRARGLSRQPAPEPSWLHVSAGLGTSPHAPIRVNCRPEASLLTLAGSGSLGG